MSKKRNRPLEDDDEEHITPRSKRSRKIKPTFKLIHYNSSPAARSGRKRCVRYGYNVSTSDETDNTSDRVSLQPLFQKLARFKQLNNFSASFGKRGERFVAWVSQVERIREMMSTDWSVLMLRCRHHDAETEYRELYSREEAFDAIFDTLVVLDTFLESMDGDHDELDIDNLELKFFAFIDVVYKESIEKIFHREIRLSRNPSTREKNDWIRFETQMSDASCGKIVVKNWETAGGAATFLFDTRFVAEDENGNELELDNDVMKQLHAKHVVRGLAAVSLDGEDELHLSKDKGHREP